MDAAFLNDVRENAVVRRCEYGSIRVFCGDTPLGRKLQTEGPRCKGRHKWVIDLYDGLRYEYVDKVCTNDVAPGVPCGRRIPVT